MSLRLARRHPANVLLAAVGLVVVVAAGLWSRAHPRALPPAERGYELDRLGLRLHARAAYREAVERDRRDLASRYRFLHTFGLVERSVVPTARAMRDADPANAHAVFGLGYAHIRLRQLAEARPLVERAAGMDPSMGYARAALGEIALFEDRDRDAAVRHYEADIARNPTFVLPYARIAEIRAEAGRHEEAIEVLRRGERAADEPWRFYKGLYKQNLLAGHYGESLRYFVAMHRPIEHVALSLALAFFTLAFWLWALRATGATAALPRTRTLPWVAAGLVAIVPARLAYVLANHWIPVHWIEALWYDFFYSVGVVGLIEEGAKLAPVALALGWRRGPADPRAWIARGVAVALGFSFYENYLYYAGLGPQAIGDRFFQSMLLHVSCTGLAAALAARGRAHRRPGIALGGLAAAALVHGGFNFLVGTGRGAGAFALFVLAFAGFAFHERLFRERLGAGEARPVLSVRRVRIFAGAMTAIYAFIPTFVFAAHGFTEGVVFAFTSLSPVLLIGTLYLLLAHHDYRLSRARRLAWRGRWRALADECDELGSRPIDEANRGALALHGAFARWALDDVPGALARLESVSTPDAAHGLLRRRIGAECGRAAAAPVSTDDPFPPVYADVASAIEALAAGDAEGALGRASGARRALRALRPRGLRYRTIGERVPRAILGWNENVSLAAGAEALALLALGRDGEADAAVREGRRAARWAERTSTALLHAAAAEIAARRGERRAADRARRRALRAHFGRPIPFVARTAYDAAPNPPGQTDDGNDGENRTAHL